ncbi:MAG: YihA family ribosome biogenesis GTP-binding protein [Gammaproteobacteria bacterium]|nr:YihA family ribosome biogenesis GTP-binding protein [Gammaproteobacteria bacterium]
MTSNAFYHRAKFLTSAAKVSQLPDDAGYEVAFAGRSNAGKSSVLNILTQQKSLARTSKTPGRTQLLNVFALTDERRLVDLPGYGYAKVAKETKFDWEKTLDAYVRNRTCLKGIILVMDIRHPLKEFDLMMIKWCVSVELPIHILLNKCDKLSTNECKSTLLQVRKELDTLPGAHLVSVQLFSTLKKIGLDECYAVLDQWLAVN